MITAIFVFSGKGELLISHLIKDHAKRSLSDIFRSQVINEPLIRSPVLTLGLTTFHHIKFGDDLKSQMWLVAVSRSNVDSAMIWEFLYKLGDISKSYGLANRDSLKDNFTDYYELLDILLSNGVPQTTDMAQIMPRFSRKLASSNQSTQPLEDLISATSPFKGPRRLWRSSSSMLTTSSPECPWRPLGLKYKKNEVYVNVNEKINVLIGKNGSLLKAYVGGTIDCTTSLSGMPLCRLGLNDSPSHDGSGERKLSLSEMMSEYDISNEKAIPTAAASSVILEDCKFHQCVQLRKFDQDNVISFVPPDGSFQLMQYHVKDGINIPFNVVPTVNLRKSSSIEINIKLKSLFEPKVIAKDVVMKIPLPNFVTNCEFSTSGGKCKFVPGESALIWKFNKYKGSTENAISASASIPANIDASSEFQRWSRPPISLQFEILMFSNSGLVVTNFKCYERQLNYQPAKWIKYISHSGTYEVRY